MSDAGPGRGKLCHHRFPVSEQALEAIACFQRRQGITSAAAVAKFDCEMERLARPPDGDEFPKKVQYESCCGHLCRSSGDHHRLLDLGRDSGVRLFNFSVLLRTDAG